MTTFQWATLVLGGLGFLITWTTGVIGFTRGIEKIKNDTSEKISSETISRTVALADAVELRKREMESFRKEFFDSQKAQDHNFGEMGSALRRFIETVEKEMHAIEIWGRDHYVQKEEFEKAIDSVRDYIKELGIDIKSDIKDLQTDLKKSVLRN